MSHEEEPPIEKEKEVKKEEEEKRPITPNQDKKNVVLKRSQIRTQETGKKQDIKMMPNKKESASKLITQEPKIVIQQQPEQKNE